MTPRTLTLLATLSVLSIAASACGRERFVLGEACTLNTDCEEPLVCGFSRCRRQCEDQRDCGAGLQCFRDESGLGSCQQDDELRCTLSSECEARLVCELGTCTTECVEDRDCTAGARCEPPAEGEGPGSCQQILNEACIYDSECPPPLVCGFDQFCHFECIDDRDCAAPRECRESLCMLPEEG